MLEARDVDGVIRSLDQIVHWSKQHEHCAGYFAALYRCVTLRVREDIGKGVFEDGPRMEALDVAFANRYLRAFEQWRDGGTPSQAWALAFEASDEHRLIVLQHLLLGMNAHINLDLGIAAAETCPGHALDALETDFMRINDLLAGMFDQVRAELSKIWRTLRWFDRHLGEIEDAVLGFGIHEARSRAWHLARSVSRVSGAERTAAIDAHDREVARFGAAIHKPPRLLRLITRIVRVGEHGNVARKIDVLARPVSGRSR